ncbi:MAG: hypothetical protein IJ600_08705 [Lachnospiraceae bacterium]|nr:hypothetical protein [Lachnospiraceae bacterium]
MKKETLVNCIKAAVFTGIAAALFVPVSYILRPSIDNRKQAFAGFYSEPQDSLDLVFMGSSSVYPYYALPYLWKEYGYTGGMLSTSIQRAENIPYLVKEAAKTQTPMLMVIEMRMFYRSREISDQEEVRFFNHVTVDNLKYSKNRFELIYNTYLHTSVSDYVDFIRYHGGWKDFTPQDIRFWDYKDHDPYKGFAFNAEVDPQQPPLQYSDEEVLPLYDYRIEEIGSLMDYCGENGITPLFIYSPYCLDAEDQQMSDTMGAIIRERGYEYIDFNHLYEELGIDFATDFYNDGHVNIHGAMKVTDYLGRYIREHYGAAPAHPAEITAEWEADYAVWKADYDACMAEWEENAAAVKAEQTEQAAAE